MRKISEGAEADIFKTNIHDMDAIVKVRIRKSYRIGKLDEEIRKRRTKSEARILGKASAAGAMTPRVLMVSKYEIFMNRLSGKMLNSMTPTNKIMGKAGRQLAMLHSLNIVHGDYTPANILVDGENVWVIDFGLGAMTSSIEEKALDILLMKRSISKRLYQVFEASYAKNYKDAKAVLQRLREIEIRGRYQTRTLLKARP